MSKCFICDSDNVGWVGNIAICTDCFHLKHSSFMLKQQRKIDQLNKELEQANATLDKINKVATKVSGGGTG